MTNKTKLAAFIIILLTTTVFAQTKEDKNKLSDELKKSTIELMHETSQDVLKMQSRSNRIVYATEIANLIWEYDEKEARSLYQVAMNEVRQSLAQLETDATLPENSRVENTNVAVPGETVRMASNTSANSYYEIQKYKVQPVRKLDYQLVRKFDVVLRFRQKLLLSLAENDPSTAEEFLRETAQIIISEEFKEKIIKQDKGLESKLALAVGKKDPNKALEAGRKMITENKLAGMASFIEKFYKLDADKAITLAEEYAKKLEVTDSGLFNQVFELVRVTESNKNIKDKKPLLSESRVKELVDAAAKQILATKNYPGSYIILSMLPTIEKYSPIKAKQIIQKFSNDKETGDDFKNYQSVQNAATNAATGAQPSKEDLENERVRNKLGKEKLTDDEKKKIMEQFRASLPASKAERTMVVVQTAQALSKSGENELAQSLLDEAKLYPPTQIETAKDGMLSWSFASTYSYSEPKKAFDLLETAIPPLNDVLDAFIKVIRFIEMENNEILENGELKMYESGPSGGFANSMLQTLQAKEETLNNLAKSDFSRTKDLANKFNRPEIQIELKLLIIKSVLGKTSEESNRYGMYNEDDVYNEDRY
jgi:truncated hemoglobin YjbI